MLRYYLPGAGETAADARPASAPWHKTGDLYGMAESVASGEYGAGPDWFDAITVAILDENGSERRFRVDVEREPVFCATELENDDGN